MAQIRELHWNDAIGKEVRIYRNLNNHRISVQIRQGEAWRVVGHITGCVLASVHFHVSEKGRQRVIKESTKNVHAWASGKLIAQFDDSISTSIDLSYNPYQNKTFVERSSQREIVECRYLTVRDNLVFVSEDALKQDSPIVIPNLLGYLDRLVPQSLQWQGMAA